ncbi:MAG: rhodanese-like domain-containing protein [Thioalkalispiraceae bacterium]|jgi:rhodanese-related sulfurtransferase
MEQYIEFIGNHYILSAIWLALFVMVIYSFVGARLKGYKNANPALATQLINQQDAVVVDVREDNEYAKGHIINSVHIPLSYLKDRIKDLEKYKDKPVIVGCKTGQRSGQACATLKKQGFEQVYNLSGGVTAWQADNLPLTKK